MQLTPFQPGIISAQSPKFRGSEDDIPEAIHKTLSKEEIHSLISKGKEQEHYHQNRSQKLEYADSEIKGIRQRIWTYVMRNKYSKGLILGGMALLGLSGSGLYYSATAPSQEVLKNNPDMSPREYSFGIGVISFLAVIGSLGMLIGGASGEQNDYSRRDRIWQAREIWEGLKDLRRALKKRDQLKSLTGRIRPETDAVKIRGIQVLKQQTQRLSEQIVANIQKAYQEHAAVKASFDQIFGSQPLLPDAQAIRELFQLYAIETAGQDRRYSFSSKNGFDESDIAQRQLALLMLCAESGELFSVLEKQKGNKGEYQPSRSIQSYLTTQLPVLETQLENFMKNYQSFDKRLGESDKYIRTARMALTAAAIRSNPNRERIQELTVLVDKLEAHKQKIQQTLTNEQQLPTLDFAQMEAFNQEMQELMIHMKVFLAVNESTPEIDGSDILGTLKTESSEAGKDTLKQKA